MTHDEIKSLLAAFALDAVEPDEAEVLAAHLHDCPRCRAEVAEHREIASFLGNEWGPPPEGVWDKIAETLFDTAPPLDAVPLRPPRRWARWRLAVPIGVAAAVIAVLGVQVAHLDNRVNDLTSALPQASLSQTVAAALASPSAHRTQLRSASGTLTANVVILPNGHGYLIGGGLPALPVNETYQLWGVTGARKVSLGLLGHRPDDVAFALGEGSGVSTLAITAERAGGVTVTNHPAVVWGPLTT